MTAVWGSEDSYEISNRRTFYCFGVRRKVKWIILTAAKMMLQLRRFGGDCLKDELTFEDLFNDYVGLRGCGK
ncbi:MAG: hypothetical protein ACTS5A_01425 [Candidatus Hodgkinia cicadicola]